MNFKNLATQVLMDQIEGVNNSGIAASALDQLAPNSENFDLGEIVSKLQGFGGNLASKAKSWLGDGANESISAAQVKEALGSDKIAAFGDKLGIDHNEASFRLAQILPELVDKSSQGGRLLDSIGDKGLFADLASKFLKKIA
jgi:uncharacterized protein YidB (DUF937 family)